MQLITGDIIIKSSPIHGWGVFTNNNLQKNDVILQSILVKIPIGEYCPSSLMMYLYSGNGSLFLTQGHAGLINSSNFPNSKFEIDIENNIITIIAIRDIFINEEITLKYL